MISVLRIVAVMVVLAGGIQRSTAQSSSTAPSSQGPLEEAAQLNDVVDTLYGDGRYRDAVAPAERVLALREKALGPSHPDVAHSLNNLAALHYAQGAYAEAEPLVARALAINEKALGLNHPDVAHSLNNLAALYQAQGAYAKAEPLIVRALRISEKALGPTDPDVAHSLNNLAALHYAQGAYAKAEPLLARALDIREKALGSAHPDVASSLHNLAEVHRAQGAHVKAEPLLARALDIREKALGPDHPDVANSLHNLAALHYAQSAYAEAEPLLARALNLREKAFGPNHPDVAQSLNNLAELYKAQGMYAEAEPLLARALHIFEKALGREHPAIATTLNNLAALYSARSAYAKAEPLYTRALDILEKALGPNHSDVATSLNNLAGLYKAQGAYTQAEPLYARALDICEKALGPHHSDVATSLNNLAGLYQAQGAYAQAEPLLARALAIREKALRPNHPDVANSLNSLASLYHARGTYAKAEPLYARALAILEKALGPSHPLVATCLNNLAGLYQDQRAYAKAEPLYARALAILEKELGRNYPDVAQTLNNLAALYLTQGIYAKVEPLLARAADIREQQLHTELERLSEPRKRALMALLQGQTERLVSFHADVVPRSEPALELALTTVLRRKGRIVDSLADSQTRLRAHLTPALRQQLDQLSHVRSELVGRLYAPAGPPTVATAHRHAIKALRTRLNELEAQLSAASEEFRTQVAPVTVTAVRSEVPADAALVEFVRYRRFDPRQPQPWQEERYVAYVLKRQGAPRWVALGEAQPIDAAVDAVLAAMDSRIDATTAQAALRQLDAQLLAPMRAQLSGIAHLIVAPDGKLNLVPFEALIDPQGRYALDSYLVSYVSSGRDLLRLAFPQRPRSSAVLIAGPDYGPVAQSPGPDKLTFTPLRGAAAEARDLQRYFPAVTNKRATKAALAMLTGPAVLHVATHGFYGWRASLAGAATRGAATRGPWLDPLRGHIGALPPPTRDLSDALDQAGLAMADANRGSTGIVTAREIAGFDWTGTQLVVLSACETGLGAVASGDGVYGLRRALVLAGAASQVVSLWTVADASTPKLMRDYYAALQQGTGRAEALRQAKRRLLQQPGNVHPFYWAAFIPAGDWRPLDATAFVPQRSMP
jgi:CHAT domain-containing protein/tetratricopeptide (TPR) repeat protein